MKSSGSIPCANAAAFLSGESFGILIPGILKRMSIDPALAGGVVLTTVTDVVGILAFIGLATFMLLGG
jgi:magnesium transporter